MVFDDRPVRRVQRRSGAAYDDAVWPYAIPAVDQVLREGLDLPAGVTFLVGENGSGKSTLVEALATCMGLNAEGGSRNARHATRVTESPLADALELVRSGSRPRWGYFLRAETMHGVYTYLESLDPGPHPTEPLHEMSHGESFLEVLMHSFARPGFYLLDEPEAALSFTSCLVLLGVFTDLVGVGAQVVCATHSPLLTALPGATIYEPDGDGLRRLAGRTSTLWTTGGATSPTPTATSGI